MKAVLAVLEALFPVPDRPRPIARPAPLLAPAVALGFALAPLAVMVEAYRQTV